MTKRRALALMFGVVGLVGTSYLLHAAQPPLARPASHTLLMENAFVQVFEIRMAPGGREAGHSHRRGVTIALSAYENETRSLPDGQSTRGQTRFGEVRWVEPVTHEVHNVGTTEQHVIRIELK